MKERRKHQNQTSKLIAKLKYSYLKLKETIIKVEGVSSAMQCPTSD